MGRKCLGFLLLLWLLGRDEFCFVLCDAASQRHCTVPGQIENGDSALETIQMASHHSLSLLLTLPGREGIGKGVSPLSVIDN